MIKELLQKWLIEDYINTHYLQPMIDKMAKQATEYHASYSFQKAEERIIDRVRDLLIKKNENKKA